MQYSDFQKIVKVWGPLKFEALNYNFIFSLYVNLAVFASSRDSRPICNSLHGPVLRLLSFQIQLLLVDSVSVWIV